MEDRKSYSSPYYAQLASSVEQRLGLPNGLLSAVITRGERSNSDQVSEAGAKGVTQVIPATRDALLKKYNVDAYASPEAAVEAGGLLLKESLARNGGDPAAAVGEYIGGTDRANWGPVTKSYINRVMTGLNKEQASTPGQEDPLLTALKSWKSSPAATTPSPGIATTPKPSGPEDPLLTAIKGWGANVQPQAGLPQAPPVPKPVMGGPAMSPDDAAAYLATQKQIPLTGNASQDQQAYARMAASEKAARDAEAKQTIGDKLVGAGETAASLISGATTGTLAAALGGGNRLAQQLTGMATGNGPGEGPSVSDAAQQAMESATYAPRTASGQQYTQAAGSAMQEYGPALMGIGPELGALGKAVGTAREATPVPTLARAATEGTARDVAGVAGPAAGEAAAGVAAKTLDIAGKAVDAVPRVAKQITSVPRRALDAALRREPAPASGAMGSVGAAGTEQAAQRVATAENLGFSGEAGLTTGQATRSPAQLKFEVETAKLPEGAPLRERIANQNERALKFFDEAIDKTGAEAPTLRAMGQTVDKALVEQYKRDKTQVNAAYAEANKSPEASARVDVASPVSVGEGDFAITGTPISFLNEQPRGLPNTGLADAARQYATRLGIADDVDGQLVPRPNVTIRQMEDWRKSINAATSYDLADIRASTTLKAMIDGQTEPVAGPMYRQARALRSRMAQNYEDRAVINKLLSDKRGTADRQVAYEDVLDHTILKGSLDDVRNVRRVLQRSGPEGQQAWRELQGATLKHIKEQAERNVATDATGNRVISPAGLDKIVKQLDADGRLDFVFGKQGAQTLRDVNEIAKVIKTVPPEAAINTSNTAATLLQTFVDFGISGAVGVPAPILSGWRVARDYIKNRALVKRIDDALNRRAR
jgi:hypothetical protein